MKKLFQAVVLTFVLALSTSNSAQANPTSGFDLSACETAELAPTCMKLLFTFRCEQYGFPIPNIPRLCNQAASETAKIFELTTLKVSLPTTDGTLKDYDLKLIFTSRLILLMRDPAVHRYLDELNFQLRSAMREESSFHLYDFTLKQTNGDAALALEWIAVLLQDTSWTQVPVRYLEKRAEAGSLSSADLKAIADLKEITANIEPEIIRYTDYQKWLSLYPTPALDQALNPSIYHYYPMAYTASLLSKLPGEAKNFDWFIPFLFNTDYEFKDLAPARWPLQHPLPFEITPNLKLAMQDLYAGYRGSLFGAKKESLALSYDEFTTRIAKDPRGEMRRYYFSCVL